jgi:hypothetical protein
MLYVTKQRSSGPRFALEMLLDHALNRRIAPELRSSLVLDFCTVVAARPRSFVKISLGQLMTM